MPGAPQDQEGPRTGGLKQFRVLKVKLEPAEFSEQQRGFDLLEHVTGL